LRAAPCDSKPEGRELCFAQLPFQPFGFKAIDIDRDRLLEKQRQIRVNLREGGIEIRMVVIHFPQPAEHFEGGFVEKAQVLMPPAMVPPKSTEFSMSE